MIIKIAGLKNGDYNYDFEEESNLYGFDENFKDKIISSIRITKYNTQILVEISAGTKKIANCDRCLEEFKVDLNCKFKILFTYEKSEIDDESFDDMRFLEQYEDKINFNEDIKQTLILSIPMKLLCKDDCKGLCVKCGQNLNQKNCGCKIENYNPNFDKLKELKF